MKKARRRLPSSLGRSKRETPNWIRAIDQKIIYIDAHRLAPTCIRLALAQLLPRNATENVCSRHQDSAGRKSLVPLLHFAAFLDRLGHLWNRGLPRFSLVSLMHFSNSLSLPRRFSFSSQRGTCLRLAIVSNLIGRVFIFN